MRKFNFRDYDIETEIDEGHDGFIFGNYVDWDRFRSDNEEQLLIDFEVDIPWGKEITVLDYSNFINQEVFIENPEILEKYKINQLKISKVGETISDLRVAFPDRKDIKLDKFISEIFDYYEVPSGQDFEFELPEELQYWHNVLEYDQSENEYEIYRKYPVKFSTYKKTINDLQMKINDSCDSMMKKSLVLSSFIVSESLLKSAIVEMIPEEDGISDFSKNAISKYINKRLIGSSESLNELFKDVFKSKAPKRNWLNLRNSLAHDIESVRIRDDKIIYINMKSQDEESISIAALFKSQIDFFEELKSVYVKNQTK